MSRIVRIPVDGDKPWFSGYFIVSCLAYPGSIENTKQKRFLDALIFRRESRRCAERSRDKYFNEIFTQDIDEGWERFGRTMSAGLILACQISDIWTDERPTLANLEPYVRELIGWSPDSLGSSYKSRIWRPSWPVIHLAAALILFIYHRPNRAKSFMGRALCGYPELVELLQLQAILWATISHKKIKDRLIKFEFAFAQEETDEESREWQEFFAVINLLSEIEPGARFRVVKDEAGTYKVELLPIELHPVPKHRVRARP
jgi:hypothetical protein